MVRRLVRNFGSRVQGCDLALASNLPSAAGVSSSSALTVGLTLVAIVTIGSLTGSMLPFVLKRFRFDPASASAPFVATLVDVSAISIYFGVAYLLLQGTLL